MQYLIMTQIKERKETMHGAEITYLGISHWMGEMIQDKLLEIDPDVICAEAPPESGFTGRMDQRTVQSHLSVTGTSVVMMDHSSRLSKQEFADRFDEETLQRVDNASGRKEIRQISSEVAHELFDKRENQAMIPRIEQTAQKPSIEKVVVVVGSEHLEGLTRG